MRREGGLDRLPFEISWGAFTPSLMETYRRETSTSLSPDEFFDFDTRSVDIGKTALPRNPARYYDFPLPAEASFNEWGMGSVPGSMEHFVESRFHPLATAMNAGDLENYDWPDIDAPYRFDGMSEKIRAYHDRGYPVLGELYCTIFETIWQLRGMDNMLMDFLDNEEMAHALCDRLGGMRCRQAAMYAGLGVDVIRLGDDVSTQRGLMMSPAIYRHFLKEPTRQIIKAAKEVNPDVLVFMHCDGKVEDLIEDYIDIGVDILNPIQPECNNFSRIADCYSNRISFWGGIGTQSLMPFGTPDDILAAVAQMNHRFKEKGGMLIAPSHILEPEVPWENVAAFVNAVKDRHA
jgi:uroporphyrinogen decarboxylase